MTALDTQGHVGQWHFATHLSQQRNATAIATSNNCVYVMGGLDRNSVLNTVLMAKANQQGEPGHKIQNTQHYPTLKGCQGKFLRGIV